MKCKYISDTGPLVALLNRRDQHHHWTKMQWGEIEPPFLTCEAVITEASYLLRNIEGAKEKLLEFLRRGVVEIAFNLHDEIASIKKLITQYRTTPMSFADACLVRMLEQNASSSIITFDKDFHIYRKHGRLIIPTLMPVKTTVLQPA
jgi:predicted nucleic acid-binding protein